MKRISAKLVQIGNSKGVRLPKAALEESELQGDVELEVRKRAIIIRPVRHLREGWAEGFQSMHAQGDDRLQAETRSSWDESEWEW